jgi:chloramphenicol-sensitive protein RarD
MTDSHAPHTFRDGLLYGLGAYVWWGLVPIYFRWLGDFSTLDFVAHRIVWSAALLAIVITACGRWSDVRQCVRRPALLAPLCVSSILVAYNWLMYVICVSAGEIVQASLGYFILPLVSVIMGMIVFHERMRPPQLLAIGCAAIGVLSLTWSAGVFPSLALAVALSFCVYGMIRKTVPVDGLIGVTVETMVLTPIALACLLASYWQRGATEDAEQLARLSLSGVVTAVPLLCFGQAARRLPLTMLGFMQYISPSLQFLLALYLFKERVIGGWLHYGLIWAALLIFSADSYLHLRKTRTSGGA